MADQVMNGLLSSMRVVVENVIAGIKRCRIVKDILRLTTPGSSDQVLEIACGLHNFRTQWRHPLPQCDLRTLLTLA